MLIERHPELRIQKCSLGNEGAPLLIVDNLVADPERLVRRAARQSFDVRSTNFPGVRARAPAMYEHFLEVLLIPLLQEHFGIRARRFAFPMCHYSLVTTPPESLHFLQRVPHVDSVDGSGLATVHYLFRSQWGGTAFYRHRGTGFECVDAERRDSYFRCLEAESHGSEAPTCGYINGTTALFAEVARAEGVFNRMVVYRRNSLHSGCIDNQHVPPPDPLAGRLSINTFIDMA